MKLANPNVQFIVHAINMANNKVGQTHWFNPSSVSLFSFFIPIFLYEEREK